MTKKELTKLKTKSIMAIIAYCFWYVFSMVQGSSMITALVFNGEHVFIKVLIFALSIAWFVFSIYIRDKSVKAYKDAKSQNEI